MTSRDLAALTAQAQSEVDALRAELPRLEAALAEVRARRAAAEAARARADAAREHLRRLVGPRDLAHEFAAVDDAPGGSAVGVRARPSAMSARDGFARQQRLHAHYSRQVAALRTKHAAAARTLRPLAIFVGALFSLFVWGVLTLLFP